MSWFKVDDSFNSHPKVVRISLAARGLWATAGSWCAQHLTDGRVPVHMLSQWDKRAASQWDKHRKGPAAELVNAGLWRETADGFEFHQWLERQPSRAEIARLREQSAERKRASRARGHSVTPGPRHTTPDPTRPDPIKISSETIEEKSKTVCNSETDAHTRAGSAHERPPVGEPPGELPAPDQTLELWLLTEHARKYSELRAGEVPMRDVRAAKRVAEWAVANATAHRTTPPELAARLLEGLFRSARAAERRWKLSWLAHDPPEFLEAPGGAQAAASPLAQEHEKRVKALTDQYDEQIRECRESGDAYRENQLVCARNQEVPRLRAHLQAQREGRDRRH